MNMRVHVIFSAASHHSCRMFEATELFVIQNNSALVVYISEADGDLISLGYGENGFLNWFSLDCELFLSPISVKVSNPGGLLNMFSREVQPLLKK